MSTMRVLGWLSTVLLIVGCSDAPCEQVADLPDVIFVFVDDAQVAKYGDSRREPGGESTSLRLIARSPSDKRWVGAAYVLEPVSGKVVVGGTNRLVGIYRSDDAIRTSAGWQKLTLRERHVWNFERLFDRSRLEE